MVASTAEKQLSPCKVNTCQLNVHTLSLAVQSVFEIAFKIVQNKEYHDCKGVCYFFGLRFQGLSRTIYRRRCRNKLQGKNLEC